MKVRMLAKGPEHIAGAFRQRGDVVEVSVWEGARLVRTGVAEYLDEQVVKAPADRMMRVKEEPAAPRRRPFRRRPAAVGGDPDAEQGAASGADA